MSLEVYPKTRKRARTVSGDSLCHFAQKKSNRETPVSEIAFILKKWVFIIRNILP
jgi:hypothetical protein